MTDIDYADDLMLLENKPAQAESIIQPEELASMGK